MSQQLAVSKNSGQKLLKHLTKKNNVKMKKKHTQNKNTFMLKLKICVHVKNLKRQLMTKDFLWRLKLHAGNWNEWPLVLRT